MRLRLFHIALLCVLLLCVGCRPKNVLSSKQMQYVLHDLHRADAILQVAGYNYGNDEALAKYYQRVLDKHGITQAQFDSSLVWYTDHPQRFDKIYPRVVASLEEENKRWIAAHEQVSLAISENKNSMEERLQERRSAQQAAREIDELLLRWSYGLSLPYWTPAPPTVSDTTSLTIPFHSANFLVITEEND